MKQKKRMILGLAIFFMGIICSYYVRIAFAETTKPSFTITIEDGEESGLDSLHLPTYVWQGGQGQSVEVSTEGTQYKKNPIFQSMYIQQPFEMESLRLRYPDFIRGKEAYSSNFTESDTYLFYAPDYYPSFQEEKKKEISLSLTSYNKETKEEEVLGNITVSSEKLINHVTIRTISYTEPYLVIQMMIGEEYDSSTHIYVYDIEKQEVVSKIKAESSPEAEEHGSTIDLFVLNQEDPMLLSVESWQVYSEEEDEIIPEVFRTFTMYSIERDEKVDVTVPEEFNKTDAYLYAEDEMVYLIQYEEGIVSILPYNIYTETVMEVNEIPVKADIFGETNYELELIPTHEGIMLLERHIYSSDDPAGVVAVRLPSMEKIVEGSIKMEAVNGSDAYFEKAYFE